MNEDDDVTDPMERARMARVWCNTFNNPKEQKREELIQSLMMFCGKTREEAEKMIS